MQFYFLEFPQTKRLFKIFNTYDIEARFVGGCVRDALAGKKTDDFDIAVNFDIQKLSEILENEDIKVIPTGIKYGSITAIVNHMKFEITTLRRDENCNGRLCDIEAVSSFEEDAKRRDFTMNALYVSQRGELFDYYNGIEDLQNVNVIFIGDPQKRIEEDYLRILRYYRFAARFHDFSDRYKEIIRREASNVSKLSIERVQKELLLILQEKDSLRIFKMIKDNGIFEKLDLEAYAKLAGSHSLEKKALALFGYETLTKTFHLTRAFKRKLKEFRNR